MKQNFIFVFYYSNVKIKNNLSLHKIKYSGSMVDYCYKNHKLKLYKICFVFKCPIMYLQYTFESVYNLKLTSTYF